MPVVDNSKPRRERSKDARREGLELLAELTTGKNHDYPACAIFRGGKCTCDEQGGEHPAPQIAALQAAEEALGLLLHDAPPGEFSLQRAAWLSARSALGMPAPGDKACPHLGRCTLDGCTGDCKK